jgi:hypothetical protein
VTERMERLDGEVDRTSDLANMVKKVSTELSNEVVYLGQTLSEIVRDATDEQGRSEEIDENSSTAA